MGLGFRLGQGSSIKESIPLGLASNNEVGQQEVVAYNESAVNSQHAQFARDFRNGASAGTREEQARIPVLASAPS